MAGPAAVTVDQVDKYYPNIQALKGVTLQIEQGEFFGLLGPNGAGKSTLINALAGLVRVDSGRLEVMGYDVQREYREARRRLGVVPQELVYDPFFTARETLRFQAGYFGLGGEADPWIDELLEALKLTDRADSNMRALSGGMKRRVLIGQALVHKPPVVVLDEPTAGVDVELRQSLWRFVRRLHSEGHTIVLTTHYLEEAEELCDRIAIINHGKLVALEKKTELLKRGISRRLHIQAADKITSIPPQLQQQVLSVDGNILQLALTRDKGAVVQALDAARDSGIDVVDIRVEEDDLESVFVQLTGDEQP